MTNFIKVASVRDFNLSASAMQHIQRIIDVENSTHQVETFNYVEVGTDGVVDRFFMGVREGAVATVVINYNMSLAETEQVLVADMPGITQLQAFVIDRAQQPADWVVENTNYRSRITAKVSGYDVADTEVPVLKRYTTTAGEALCSVLAHHMCIALQDEPTTVTVQKLVDTLAGIAYTEGRDFAVQAKSAAWIMAMEANPNYVFQNCMIIKFL